MLDPPSMRRGAARGSAAPAGAAIDALPAGGSPMTRQAGPGGWAGPGTPAGVLLRARRWAMRAAGLLAGLCVLALLTSSPDGPALAQTTSWIELFDGTPASPQPYNPSTWDVLVHSREAETWKQLQPMAAHHGSNCAGAPASHQISAYADAVFQCNGHVMTAIYADAYGLIVLTPNRMVDFSGGEAVIRFDMTTFRSAPRDWVSFWLSPWDEHLPLPLQEWYPDGSGEPRRGVHVEMSNFNGGTTFNASVIQNHVSLQLPSDFGLSYESFLTTSAVRRDPFELRISRTSLKFGMPTYGRWWVNATFPDLGWDRAVLQLAHHSYTPFKDCAPGACAPNTWHWDNVQIDKAVPFVMLKGDRPWVDRTSRRYVQFNPSAPLNSSLRFVGIGTNLQVSFDGGVSWQLAQMKPVEKNVEELFKPYWMPVPPGTSRVDFRGDGWWGGDWMVNDPVIWSQTVPLPPPTSTCSPRPRTTVQTQPLGSGRLQVTVQVGRPAYAASNIIRSVRVVGAQNAQVSVLGQTFGAGGGTAVPTSATQSVTLTVIRTAGGSVTVPLAIADDCGEWTTFVGGGPSAF
ncbi:MAG: hypothetical protein IT306_20285 [Chloroflexi bacterium]|nr:hypothetical protein [Chloroflexota bacterium]